MAEMSMIVPPQDELVLVNMETSIFGRCVAHPAIANKVHELHNNLNTDEGEIRYKPSKKDRKVQIIWKNGDTVTYLINYRKSRDRQWKFWYKNLSTGTEHQLYYYRNTPFERRNTH